MNTLMMLAVVCGGDLSNTGRPMPAPAPLVVPTPPEVQPAPPAVTYSAPQVCVGGNCAQPQQTYQPFRLFRRFNP